MIKLSKFSSIFVANWKLNGNLSFINQYLDSLKVNPSQLNCVIICPPTIYLNNFNSILKNCYLGSQDISKFESGAYTGEISSKSLNDFGVKFCIVGHSERRQYFNENNNDIKNKASKLIKNNIIPIICIGESLKQKNENKTIEVLSYQINNSIPPESNQHNTIIAYEPIWAIGTGLTPTIDEIENLHYLIRKNNIKIENFKILYGGSVNLQNSREIINLTNVDGALIGGASLKIDEFNQIIA